MSSGASGSGWIWNPDKGAYLNPKTGTWATPQSGGEWSYSDSVDVRAKEVVDEEEEVEEDGEIDGEPIPEDQVWPGGPDASEADYSQAPILRFVVLHSDVLPSQQVGIPDPGETLSFGRDRSFEKRIRLKELPVSKTHATCFWLERGLENEDKGEGCWAVADCGSTHGTWVKADGDQKALRLSPPKVASAPRELHHLELVPLKLLFFASAKSANTLTGLSQLSHDWIYYFHRPPSFFLRLPSVYRPPRRLQCHTPFVA